MCRRQSNHRVTISLHPLILPLNASKAVSKHIFHDRVQLWKCFLPGPPNPADEILAEVRILSGHSLETLLHLLYISRSKADPIIVERCVEIGDQVIVVVISVLVDDKVGVAYHRRGPFARYPITGYIVDDSVKLPWRVEFDD